MALEIVTSSERPDLEREAAAAFRQRWPEFVFHDPVVPAYLPRVQDHFKDLDVLLLVDGHVAAGGWGVSLVWDGTVEDLPAGYDAALVRSVEDHEAARVPTTLSFMAAAVHPDQDAQGLATEVLHALVGRATATGLTHVVAPIRPTAKHRHPEVPMSDYATWVREDGLSTDPWIRTHQRMGARILGVAAASMVVPGTVAEWEQWAGTALPASGRFVVPDGLNLLVVDRDADTATYTEENLWVQHR